MKKISVIIPIYNVEKYVKKAVESVLAQTFKDIEVICIDDGSTDNSLKIVQNLALKDNKVKVLHQENSGVSVARNLGLDSATGEFIMFLDGDDYYEKKACSVAYDYIVKNKADIGVFGISNMYMGIKLPCIMNKNIKRANKMDYADIDLWKFQTYSVNKIYRKDFIKNNNLYFEPGLVTAEDAVFSFCSLFSNPKYCFIPKSLYVYRKNRLSSATTKLDSIKNDLNTLKVLREKEIFQQQSMEIQIKIVEKFCSGCWNFYKRNRKKLKTYVEDVKELIAYIEDKYDVNELKKLKKYNQIKSIV